MGENSDVTYRFQTASDYFEINSNTGDIKTSRLLEPAAVRLHRLAVIATDGGDPAHSSTGMCHSLSPWNARTGHSFKLQFINCTLNANVLLFRLGGDKSW